MKEMYKDNRGTWHYGTKGEKLTEVSYSTNSVPKSWCKLMGMYCSMATINGYCQVTACCNTSKPTVKAIPVEFILKWANKNCMYCYDYDYPTEKIDGWFDINNMINDWEKENEID